MAARATAVHRKNQEELEGRVKRPKLSMPDLPSARGTVIRQPTKSRSTNSGKGKGPAPRKYSLRSGGTHTAAPSDKNAVSAQPDTGSGEALSGHGVGPTQSHLSKVASTPPVINNSERHDEVTVPRGVDVQNAQKPFAPRKRKQGMSGLIGASGGDAPVMSALHTPPPQQTFPQQQQLPNAAALAVGSGICPPPPFIMAAPVVILSPSSPVPTITATQPRIIPHHSLPRVEHSPFQPHAVGGYGFTSSPQPPSNAAFGTGFHGTANGMETFNPGVIHFGAPLYNSGIPSLLQPRPQPRPQPLLSYARGDSGLMATHSSSVPDDSTPSNPLEHMARPQQGGRRPGVVLSSAEHERMMQQLDIWQEGGADTPPQQHPVPSSVATSSLSHLAYQGSPPVFPPPGSHSRPYFPQFTTPTQFRPPTDMSVPALSHTPPPNFDSDIIVLSDSSGDETEPESSTSSPLMFSRRWMHAPSRAEEGVELRSHSPSSIPWPPLPGRGRGPIPAFSISPSRRASLPGETTPERHRADRQELDDAELARRLQMEEYGMVTPAPVPVNPVTSDPDLERLRSSPFPHYDPEQHPWAPSPPSQLSSHRLSARIRTSRLRRHGNVVPPEPEDINDPAHITNNWGDLSRRARSMSRVDARRLIRNALLLRGRSPSHASSRVISDSIRSLPPGMLVMAMTMELGYEHLLELADLLGPGRTAGLSQEELDQIPVQKYTVQATSNGSDSAVEKCIVCLSEYEEGDTLRHLKCGHDFHKDCIDQWLQGNATCPVCRSNAKEATAGRGPCSSTTS